MTAVICVAAYMLVATAYLVSSHRWNRMQAARVRRLYQSYPACVDAPAPVTPPFTQTVASADWFWAIPSDCLGDDAVRSLCDDIERRNFR